MALNEMLNKILLQFPQKHLRMAFAYGSGVFQQQGHANKSQNMIDYIFVVDNPTAWHSLNLKKNRSHYSWLKYLGPRRIARIQDNYGSGVYFNTLVPVQDKMIKYGVVSTDTLNFDLLDWETLYISGRLHKPVNILHEAPELQAALRMNLKSAIHASLLLLPESFNEEELFLTIAGLSYAGDFRMTIGEDKNKVANIVGPNLEHFKQLYSSYLDSEPHLYWNRSMGSFEQNLCANSLYHHLNLLPKKVLISLMRNMQKVDGLNRDIEEVIYTLSNDPECSRLVQQSLVEIVQKSSLLQSGKGILTAGFSKSLKYSFKKLIKMWKGKNK